MIGKIILLALVGTVFAASVPKPGSRIVGGDLAERGQFPFQVSVRMQHSHICGGSIINEYTILTAAHCVVDADRKPYPAKEFSVRVGTNNRIAGGVIHDVSKVFVKEDYEGFINDVAIFHLAKPIALNPKAQPVALETEELAPGTDVTITGWGLEETNGADIPIHLKVNKVKAISTAECQRKIFMKSELLICLSHPKGDGACNGDSGGPASRLVNGEHRLVGIAGFVVTGCGSSRPDGYAKVSRHVEWIKQHTKN